MVSDWESGGASGAERRGVAGEAFIPQSWGERLEVAGGVIFHLL